MAEKENNKAPARFCSKLSRAFRATVLALLFALFVTGAVFFDIYVLEKGEILLLCVFVPYLTILYSGMCYLSASLAQGEDKKGGNENA